MLKYIKTKLILKKIMKLLIIIDIIIITPIFDVRKEYLFVLISKFIILLLLFNYLFNVSYFFKVNIIFLLITLIFIYLFDFYSDYFLFHQNHILQFHQ